jgi:hypothetical protein
VVSVIDKDKGVDSSQLLATNGKELGRPSVAVPYGSIGMYRMIHIASQSTTRDSRGVQLL